MLYLKRLADSPQAQAVQFHKSGDAPDAFLADKISPIKPPHFNEIRLDAKKSYTTSLIAYFKHNEASESDTLSILKYCAYAVKDSELTDIPTGRKWLFFLNMIHHEAQSTGLESLSKILTDILTKTFGGGGVLHVAILPTTVHKTGQYSSRAKRREDVQESFAGDPEFRHCTDASQLWALNRAAVRQGYSVFESAEITLLDKAFRTLHGQTYYRGLRTEPTTGETIRNAKFVEYHQPVLLPIKQGLIDTRLYKAITRPTGITSSADPELHKKLVIFCSGSGSSSEVYAPQTVLGLLSPQSEFDCDVLTFNYRGFGMSSDCEVDDKTITRDTQAMVDHAIRNLGYKPEHIFIWGFSLGSIPATRVACGLYRTPDASNLQTHDYTDLFGSKAESSAVLEKDPYRGKKAPSDPSISRPLGGLITYGAIASIKEVMLSGEAPSPALRLVAGIAQAIVGFNLHDAMRQVQSPTFIIAAGQLDPFHDQSVALSASRQRSTTETSRCRLIQLDANTGASHIAHTPLFDTQAAPLSQLIHWFNQPG